MHYSWNARVFLHFLNSPPSGSESLAEAEVGPEEESFVDRAVGGDESGAEDKAFGGDQPVSGAQVGYGAETGFRFAPVLGRVQDCTKHGARP